MKKQFRLKEKLQKILDNKDLNVNDENHYEFILHLSIKQLFKDYKDFKKTSRINGLRKSYKLQSTS